MEALSRWKPLSARRRMLKIPSSGVVSAADTCDDLSMEGERLFHAATMLRTELNGERGDVCGRLSEVPIRFFEVQLENKIGRVRASSLLIVGNCVRVETALMFLSVHCF
jgi:hypothetical protein